MNNTGMRKDVPVKFGAPHTHRRLSRTDARPAASTLHFRCPHPMERHPEHKCFSNQGKEHSAGVTPVNTYNTIPYSGLTAARRVRGVRGHVGPLVVGATVGPESDGCADALISTAAPRNLVPPGLFYYAPECLPQQVFGLNDPLRSQDPRYLAKPSCSPRWSARHSKAASLSTPNCRWSLGSEIWKRRKPTPALSHRGRLTTFPSRASALSRRVTRPKASALLRRATRTKPR